MLTEEKNQKKQSEMYTAKPLGSTDRQYKSKSNNLQMLQYRLRIYLFIKMGTTLDVLRKDG